MVGFPLRVFLVGLTHTHAGWAVDAARRGEIDVVAVLERDDAVFARYAANGGLDPGVRVTGLDDGLQASPDAIVCMGDTAAHAPLIASLVGRSRVPVMVEKPLARTHSEAVAIAASAAAGGIAVVVHLETNWYRSLRTVEARLATGEWGRLQRMVFRTGHSGPVARSCPPEFLAWCADPAVAGGGALMDFGCYGALQALWFAAAAGVTGEPRVTATAAHLQPAVYPFVEDDATITVQWPDGPVAVIAASWNWADDYKDAEVYTDRVRVDAGRWDDLWISVPGEAANPAPLMVADATLASMWAHLSRVCEGGPIDPLCGLELNIASMRILDAAREAAGLPVVSDAPASQ